MNSTQEPTRKTLGNLTREDFKFLRRHSVLSAASLVFMLVFWYLVHADFIRLYPKAMNESNLEDSSARIVYTLRYQSLLILWLMFNVYAVIHCRIKNVSINPLDEEIEPRIQGYKNILTNSLESIYISITSQHMFATFAEAGTVLRFIPFFNILMLISRIAFFIGYPLDRGFGVQSTLVPNTFLVGYNTIQLASFLFK